jgi:hypothetical protein
MDAGEKAVVDAATLISTKARLVLLVDSETERRISLGFEYPASSGTWHSLSEHAQINWLGMLMAASSLTYPYVILSRDDMASYTIPNVADAQTLAMTAFGMKEWRLGAGRAVKDAVRQAVTVAAAEAAAATYLAGG